MSERKYTYQCWCGVKHPVGDRHEKPISSLSPAPCSAGAWLGRDWWPLCAVCGKVVDNLEAVPLPANPDKYQRAIRDYIVTCHGETEKHIVGIWAAHEIASRRKRLPDAFKRLVRRQR